MHEHNGYFQYALRQNKDNFDWFILEEVPNEFSLNEKEKFWIKHFNSNNSDYGYNMTIGGDGGDIISNLSNCAEIREKIKIGVAKASPNRIFRPLKEIWTEIYGQEEGLKKYEETYKKRGEKISKSKMGKFYSDEHKKAISDSLKGKKLSQERIEKMKGKIPVNIIKFSCEEEQKIIMDYKTKSLKCLGREWKVSKQVIKRILKKHNIEIIPRKNQYK